MWTQHGDHLADEPASQRVSLERVIGPERKILQYAVQLELIVGKLRRQYRLCLVQEGARTVAVVTRVPGDRLVVVEQGAAEPAERPRACGDRLHRRPVVD